MNALESKILDAVEEYLEATEAWDDAQLVINRDDMSVALMEEEDTDSLPDSSDVYDIMDFISMNPQGDWMPDKQVISVTAKDYSE